MSGLADAQQSGRRLTADEFRDVIGRFASGVTVVTTVTAAGEPAGTTASAVSSLTLEPPMLLVCMNRSSSTGRAMAASGRFAVNVLGEDDGELALRFATKGTDKFAGVETLPGPDGAPPMLAGALASMVCTVAQQVVAGTHVVFLATVDDAVSRAGAPLAYFRGRFGRLELAEDRAVYEAVRERVLDPAVLPGHALDCAELAGALGAARGAVHQALGRLAAEGLVQRGPDGGHVVRDASPQALDDTYAARRAIELGVVEATVGRVAADQVAELRRLMEATVGLIRGGRFVDVDRWVSANAAFHEHHVAMAGSSALSSAYRHLGLWGIDARALRADVPADPVLVWDHERLVEAYETGDLGTAREVVARHVERRNQASGDVAATA